MKLFQFFTRLNLENTYGHKIPEFNLNSRIFNNLKNNENFSSQITY